MASITMRLSERVDARGKSEILLRFIGGRGQTFRLKSHIFISPSKWNQEEQRLIIRKLATPEQKELLEKKQQLEDLCNFLMEEHATAEKDKVTKEWMQEAVERFWHPADAGQADFFEEYALFIERSNVCPERKEQFRVVMRDLQRFEKYRGRKINFDDIDADFLEDLQRYLSIEHTLVGMKKYRHVFADCRKVTFAPRSQNTVSGIMKKFRVFIKDACSKKKGLMKEDPFKEYHIEAEMYGTPYYLTLEERDAIYRCDLHNHPHLEVQRDIFVFQCLCGARYGDLERFRKTDIVDGVLEYIPHKTNGNEKIGLLRIPLTDMAMDIVRKYSFMRGPKLFPFISLDKFNADLQKIMMAARMNRYVSVLNPVTRREEKHKLWEVATSHIARRTFVGNLYKQVQDQNLISSMSGHVEGSKAFARYRTIDMDIKKDVIKFLNSDEGKH